MADQQISQLNTLNSGTVDLATDLIPIVDTSTNESKHITAANLIATKANDADVVKLTGDQTVAGTKTFSTIPELPASNPTTANQASRKTYVDTKVSLTGNETVAGIKTFSSFPISPSSAPTTDYQLANKKYVDDNAGGGGVTVESSASTSYTLVIGDADKYKRMTAATAVTITVPTNASVAFPTGTVVTFVQAGAGQITVSPVSGTVTLNGGNKSFKQYSVIQVIKVATDTWDLIGGIE